MVTVTLENFRLAEQKSIGQTYPVYVNNLKEAGVHSYTVDVATHDRHIFSDDANTPLVIPGNKPLKCADKFDEAALKTALKRTQTGQSDFPTFMKEIADAGIHTYKADLLKRTVRYMGSDTDNYYEEAVP